MALQSRLRFMFQLWNRLTEPFPQVQDADQRYLSHLLSGILLLLAFIIGTILPLRYITTRDAQTPVRLVSAGLGFIIVVGAYLLARRGRTQAAITIVIILATLLITLTAIILGPATGMRTLYYLTVIGIFAGLFLNFRTAIIIFVTHIAMLALLPIAAPSYSIIRITEGPLSFNLVLTVTVVVFAWYRVRLETQKNERLADSETRYRIVSELISDYAYSYTVDADGGLHEDWITGSFANVTGYTWEELDQYILFHPDYSEQAAEDVKRVLRGEAVTNEYLIITKDGHERWMRITRQPVWDIEKKRVVRFYAVAQDVTQHREVEAQKLNMAVQQGRMGVIGDFVQAVSHDFRTSLATIETNRYLIEKTFDSIEPPKTQTRLETIQQSVVHLTEQLENLHMLSALIAPKTETSIMNKLVNDLILGQVPAAQHKHIALTFTPELYLSPVMADIGEIQRAVNQLLTNAINYTPEGGKVNVRTYQANKMVSVEIRDSGIGIDDDDIDNIFDVFYRADPSRSLESGGVGLGLSMVKMIAEAHNGTVTVTSVPGQGSIFTFSLPAIPSESRSAS
ncbi:MAG: ATP-binding protein [Chloroflexota bacterium]